MKFSLSTRAGRGLLTALFLFTLIFSASAQRQMERLGRGVVALHSATSQAYIGWRLLATEPTDIGFNLYRSTSGAAGVKLNSQPLTNTTDYLDTNANFTVSNAWYVVPVTNGVEGSPSVPAGLAANSAVRQYLSWPLQATGGTAAPYDVKFCWVGDLDGDGEYDYVVDRLSTTIATNQYLQAYKRDGTFLWQLNCGYNSTNQYNIEPGASAISIGHGDCVTVYDMDGDGKAEVCIRTARGVILPNGTTITGPDDTTQYLSILDGLTGNEVARTTITNMWPGDGPMNSHFGIMYADGVHPSLLIRCENRNASSAFQRESMTYDYRNGQLTRRWFQTPAAGANESWGHQIRIMDVNHDGIDDSIDVGSVLNGVNGQTLFDTELVHGDRFHVTDIDPDRAGLEMYSIQQNNPTLLATALIDASSGALLKKWYSGGIADVGRGIALDMDPRYRGCELYSTQPRTYDCQANEIWHATLWPPEAIWWDGDLLREFEDGAGSGALNPVINKYDLNSHTNARMYTIYTEGVHQAYGGRAAFWGDILGDWREEVVLVADTYTELRVYTTKIAATNRLYCLMQNPGYRDQATCKGYYQASYVDYYLANDMPPPPTPPISDAKLVWRGDGVNVWDAAATTNWRTNWFYVGNANTNPAPFNSGDTVLFDLTGSNNAAITLVGSLTPGDVRIHAPKNFTFDSSNGSLDGATKFTKGGAGKVTFNGTNNFTGKTLISEGTLVVNGALPNSPVVVRGGVWLDGRLGGNGVVGSAVSFFEGAGVSPGQGTNSPGTLTLANNITMNGRTLNDFDLSDDATGTTKTNDLLVITGNLTVTGTNTFVIRKLNATLPPGGVYPLINYSGTFSGSLANFTVSGLTGIPFVLTNPPGQLALVIKNFRAPATLTWTGGQNGNAWDLTTSSNWLNGAAKDQFAPNDTVRFDNTGASNLTVTLSGDLVCSNLIVDTTNNYTLTGSGTLLGTAGLTKSNSGTLTITALNHTFTGKTILAGGTLVVSEIDAVGYASSLGNPPGGSTNLVFYNSPTLRITGESYTDRGLTINVGTNTLDVQNAADQLTIAGVITGAGALQKSGPGTFTVTANNTYTGPTLITGGELSLGGGTVNQYGLGLGPGGNGNTTITISNATLRMFSDSASYDNTYWNLVIPTNSYATIYADDRVNLYGTLTGSGTLNYNVYYVRTELWGNWSAFSGNINMQSDNVGGDFRILNSSGYGNAAITMLASNTFIYHASGSAVALGAIASPVLVTNPPVMSGTPWTVGSRNLDTTFNGRITGTSVTKVGTGTWTLAGDNPYTGATTISGGTLQIGSGGAAGTIGSGAITDNATLAFNRSDSIADTNFSIITGSGTLAKRGAGKLTLTKAHTYTGATLIETGTLALEASGSVANSSNIIVSGGTFFDVSARTSGDMTLASGKQISGGGTINGGFTIGSGAKLSPGTNSIGTLTFSNGLTLTTGSTNILEISKTPKTNDLIKITGTLTMGGTLIVSNLAGTLAIGDNFRIFNATTLTGTFTTVNLPTLTAGLTWNRAGLATVGIISVVTNTPPTFASAAISGTNLALTVSGGVPGALYYLITTTNVALPLAQWTPVLTNNFDNAGLTTVNTTFTNNPPQKFFRLIVP